MRKVAVGESPEVNGIKAICSSGSKFLIDRGTEPSTGCLYAHFGVGNLHREATPARNRTISRKFGRLVCVTLSDRLYH